MDIKTKWKPMMDCGECSKCNGRMDMYYVKWCPLCDKPEPEQKPVLNLLQALTHIGAKTNDNHFKRRFMHWFTAHFLYVNGSYVLFQLDGNPVTDDVALFVETFGIDTDKGVILYLNW